MSWAEDMGIDIGIDYEPPYLGSHRYKEIITETEKAWLVKFNKKQKEKVI